MKLVSYKSAVHLQHQWSYNQSEIESFDLQPISIKHFPLMNNDWLRPIVAIGN